MLLWLAAIAAATIPFTSLIGWASPALGMQGSASMAALGVDLVALLGALCFAWMARSAAHRVEYGPADSVWAASHRQLQEATR